MQAEGNIEILTFLKQGDKKYEADLMAILTKDQVKKLTAMKGKPFIAKKLPLPFIDLLE